MRVLIVEDDEVDIILLRRALNGHEVEAIQKAREAANAAIQFKPDVIFCDVRMPAILEGELVAILRGLNICPVIPISQSDEIPGSDEKPIEKTPDAIKQAIANLPTIDP
jgi:CheY-like chemotaxis protein